MNVTINLPVRVCTDWGIFDDMLADVWPGIDYWVAETNGVRRVGEGRYEVRTDDSDTESYILDKNTFVTGISRIVRSLSDKDGFKGLHRDNCKKVAAFLVDMNPDEEDDADYDAEMLDWIIQAAFFWEVVYG